MCHPLLVMAVGEKSSRRSGCTVVELNPLHGRGIFVCRWTSANEYICWARQCFPHCVCGLWDGKRCARGPGLAVCQSVISLFFSAADTCQGYFKPFDNRPALLRSSMAANEQSTDQLERCWSRWLPRGRVFPGFLVGCKMMVVSRTHFSITCSYIVCIRMYVCLYTAHFYSLYI